MPDRPPTTAARMRLALATMFATALALTACSTVDDVRTVTDVEVTRSATPGSSTNGSGTSGSGTSVTDARSAPLVDLGKVIVTSVDTVHGGPWQLQPFAVGDTGPTDLAKAISDDGGSDAEKVLTDAGFIDGYQQLFTADAPGTTDTAETPGTADTPDTRDQLVVQLFRFEAPEGASSYLKRWSDTLASAGEAFSVINLPDAVAVGTEDATAQSAIVLLTYDVTFIAVQATVAAGQITNQEVAGLAADVARQQLAKLVVTTH